MTVNSDCVQGVGMRGTLSSISILNISTLRCSVQWEVSLAGVVNARLEHRMHTVVRGLA